MSVNRRLLLQAGTAALAFGAVAGLVYNTLPPDFSETLDDAADLGPAQGAFASFLSGRDAHRLVISNSSHSHTRAFLRFMTQDAFARTLLENGYRDAAVEVHASLQDLVRDFSTPETFARNMEARYQAAGVVPSESARQIYRARGEWVGRMLQFGISPHFVENQSPTLADHVRDTDILNAHFAAAARSVWAERLFDTSSMTLLGRNLETNLAGLVSPRAREHHLRRDVQENENAYRRLRERGTRPFIAALETLIRQRLAHDAVLADTIESITQGRRAMIFYGNDHGRNIDDLDEKLVGSVARLTLCTTRDAYVSVSQSDAQPGTQMPAAYLVLQGGQLVPQDVARLESAQFLGENRKAAALQLETSTRRTFT